MKTLVIITGCDDSTGFELDINNEQFKFLKLLEEKSREISRCSCMPTISIYSENEYFIEEEYDEILEKNIVSYRDKKDDIELYRIS